MIFPMATQGNNSLYQWERVILYLTSQFESMKVPKLCLFSRRTHLDEIDAAGVQAFYSVSDYPCVRCWCAVERKKIKSYLRSSMSQGRVNNLAFLTIEREFLREMLLQKSFYDDMIDVFAEKKHRINTRRQKC